VTTPVTGASTAWLPTADRKCATVVHPADRCSTIHEVIELSNAVEPSGRSTCPSNFPHTTEHTTTKANDPSNRRISQTGRLVFNTGLVDTRMTTTTLILNTPEADLAYDVRGPLPTADGRPLLFMVGQPMTADGFDTLASYFPDRTVVTYDPRGLGRSIRKDGRVDNTPTLQARDLHSLIVALGAGPVEMFASSGGAVTALALVAAYAGDVTTLVAHEPPLVAVLPDSVAAERALASVRDAYEANGSNAGMAAFLAMTSWQGEFTDEYFSRPAPDPAAFGMPADDDGSRDSPLLSDRSWAVSSYRPDVDALFAAPTRVVIAVAEESGNSLTGRTSRATADLLSQLATVFPSHHGGFVGADSGYPGKPEAFAHKLREVLDGNH